jgi:hypothetical protein
MIMEPEDCWVVINMRSSSHVRLAKSQGQGSAPTTPCPANPTGEHIANANYLTTIDYSTEHNGECVAVMQCSACLWSSYVTYVVATEAITDYLIDEDGNVWMDGEGNDYPHHSLDLTI